MISCLHPNRIIHVASVRGQQRDIDRQRDKDTAEIKQCQRENRRQVLCRRRQHYVKMTTVCLSYANIRKFGFDSKAKNRLQLRAQWKDTEIWGSRGCDLSDLCLLGECDAV